MQIRCGECFAPVDFGVSGLSVDKLDRDLGERRSLLPQNPEEFLKVGVTGGLHALPVHGLECRNSVASKGTTAVRNRQPQEQAGIPIDSPTHPTAIEWPAFNNLLQRLEPRNPAPPVTRYFIIFLILFLLLRSFMI